MPNTTDPRRFCALTRIALLPSLCPENQPLVAVESMINGIPVIGSDRGGIPEVLGDCGFVLPLPERLTPVSKLVPEAEEVEPWVETIIRLWDDRALYEEQSLKARAEAQRWHPDRLRPLYAEFFRSVRLQPGPPLVSRPADGNGVGGREHSSPGVVGTDRMNRNRLAPLQSATGHALSDLPEMVPLSFVVCVSDTLLLQDNLLASPCLQAGSPHEVISVLNAPSVADGLNAALDRALHEWVVLVHYDVHLPLGWDRQIIRQLREAERRFGRLGIAGVYGVGEADEPTEGSFRAERIGWVVDRGRLLRQGPDLPARVATLDELLLILPRGTSLRCDRALGFHLYGADLCLQAREQGLAAVVLEALCHHNSRSVGLNDTFFENARAFIRKWAQRLPIATPCAVFDRLGQVFLLGNADGDSSIALAEGGPLHRIDLEPSIHLDRTDSSWQTSRLCERISEP
jgi:hypothetical protein